MTWGRSCKSQRPWGHQLMSLSLKCRSWWHLELMAWKIVTGKCSQRRFNSKLNLMKASLSRNAWKWNSLIIWILLLILVRRLERNTRLRQVSPKWKKTGSLCNLVSSHSRTLELSLCSDSMMQWWCWMNISCWRKRCNSHLSKKSLRKRLRNGIQHFSTYPIVSMSGWKCKISGCTCSQFSTLLTLLDSCRQRTKSSKMLTESGELPSQVAKMILIAWRLALAKVCLRSSRKRIATLILYSVVSESISSLREQCSLASTSLQMMTCLPFSRRQKRSKMCDHILERSSRISKMWRSSQTRQLRQCSLARRKKFLFIHQ